MAARAVWNKSNSDGTTTYIYDDGSLAVWNLSTGEKVREAGANPQLAQAIQSGDTNTMQQTIDYGTQWLASPMGQDYISTRQAASDEEKRRYENTYGLQKNAQNFSQGMSKDQLNFDKSKWNDQYGLQRDEFGFKTGPEFQLEKDKFGQNVKESDARILDLERKYGLDSSRLALDYNKQSIDYAKTPRSWLDSLDWERGGAGAGIPVYMQNLAANISNPAFQSKGAGTPQMNSLGQTVADASGNQAAAAADPTAETTKAIAGIAKLSPPSSTVGMSGRDAATIQLLTEMYKNGAGKIGEGKWESLMPDEQDTILGTFDRVAPNGGNRWLQDLGRTRIPTASRAYATG